MDKSVTFCIIYYTLCETQSVKWDRDKRAVRSVKPNPGGAIPSYPTNVQFFN